jgi:hypothetical protein
MPELGTSCGCGLVVENLVVSSISPKALLPADVACACSVACGVCCLYHRPRSRKPVAPLHTTAVASGASCNTEASCT